MCSLKERPCRKTACFCWRTRPKTIFFFGWQGSIQFQCCWCSKSRLRLGIGLCFLGLPRGLFASPRAWWWWGWLVVACGCWVLCQVCSCRPGLLCWSLRFLLLCVGCCCWCLLFLGLAVLRSPLLAAVLRSLRSFRALAFLFLSLCLVLVLI